MSAVDYSNLASQKSTELQKQMESSIAKRNTVADYSSLKGIILENVVNMNYSQAKKELNSYIESKKDFPQFESRTERYIRHCVDIISAIETKRDFSVMGTISFSKQQELTDRVLSHFDELKSFLKRIEKVGHEVIINDYRSTAMVLKSIMVSAFVIFLVAFGLDFYSNGFVVDYGYVMGDVSDDFVGYLFSLVGIY